MKPKFSIVCNIRMFILCTRKEIFTGHFQIISDKSPFCGVLGIQSKLSHQLAISNRITDDIDSEKQEREKESLCGDLSKPGDSTTIQLCGGERVCQWCALRSLIKHSYSGLCVRIVGEHMLFGWFPEWTNGNRRAYSLHSIISFKSSSYSKWKATVAAEAVVTATMNVFLYIYFVRWFDRRYTMTVVSVSSALNVSSVLLLAHLSVIVQLNECWLHVSVFLPFKPTEDEVGFCCLLDEKVVASETKLCAWQWKGRSYQ